MAEYTRYNINDGISNTEHKEWFLLKPSKMNISEIFIKEYKKTISSKFTYFIEGEE